MTDAQKVSAIKRINERRAQMGRDFGEDSSLYRDFDNAIYLAIPDDALLPSGNISHGKKAMDLIDDKVIEKLLRKDTAGDIKKKAKEEAKRESEETGENVSWRDIIDAQEAVYEVIEDDYSEFYEAVKLYWGEVGKGHPKPMYSTIKEIIDAQTNIKYDQEAGNASLAEERERFIRDKLKKRIEAEEPQRRYFE